MKILSGLMAIIVILALLMGCGNDEPTPDSTNIGERSDQLATDNSLRNSDPPEDPPSQNQNPAQNFSLTTINTTFEGTEVSPMALSLEEAAQIGAQYIQDIFGENINGMYVELDFANWEHMTRNLWHGAVSVSRRNTLENRARFNELNDEFTARLDAGEDMDDIQADMDELFRNVIYTPALFYFAIDAVTGKRINIWRSTSSTLNQLIPGPMAMEEYVEREWGGDWEAAFHAEITPQEKDELHPLAIVYAHKQFDSTTVMNVEFSNSFASLIYAGNGNFNREYSVTFYATDETGRGAHITFELASRTMTSISTISNDFIPFDDEMMEIEREERFRGEDEYSDERSIPAEQEDE